LTIKQEFQQFSFFMLKRCDAQNVYKFVHIHNVCFSMRSGDEVVIGG
jgi:hypothetical protein